MNSASGALPRALRWILFTASCACALWTAPVGSTSQQANGDGVSQLVARIQQALQSGDPAKFLELVQADGARLEAARAFARDNILADLSRVVVRERDRGELTGAPAGTAYRIALEVFCETKGRGRLSTWRLDVVRKRGSPANAPEFVIASQRSMSSFGALYRLALAPRQYRATNIVVRGEDLELRLPNGSAFTAETDNGTTVLVLLGRGQMVFKPTPATEREQMKIFSGSDRVDTTFTSAFIRLAPSSLQSRLASGTLEERPVDAEETRLAQQVFRDDNVQSFAVNLGDLTGENWSLVPDGSDFIAEVHTQRYGTLTYARSAREAEDINLFNRTARQNISLYASPEKLAERGRFYNDEDLESFEVLHYDIEASIEPMRESMEGVARLIVRTRADMLANLSLRLAETLQVRSVTSSEFGRLITFRVRDHNNCIVNLPEAVPKDTVLRLTIAYAGRVAPQLIDREAIEVTGRLSQDPTERDINPVLEPSYLYSNRSFWYPQAGTASFATATLRVRVPSAYTCVGSGDVDGDQLAPDSGARQNSREFVFHAIQPLRYLSVLVARLVAVRTVDPAARLSTDVAARERPGAYYSAIGVRAFASPRLRGRAASLADSAADILRFYSTLIGDCPYPTLTLAVVERELPGGHSPGFLAVLAQPTLSTPFNWRSDPTSFSDYPEFFLAHELAHQWWGQAVGWKNYHEQWLSEGLAQYFSALYAERLHGQNLFGDMVRQLTEWGVKKSAEGPVYLGYRIGHIKRDGQLFRAIVYNKAAASLHMLRRLLGDDVFFRGLRRFYSEYRFRRAGSDDLRRAMEAESGVGLGRFFERWIYDSRIPTLKFSSRNERDATTGRDLLVVRFEQTGDVFDVPVTVTLTYSDRPAVNVVVKVTEAVTEMRIPLAGRLRGVKVNEDDAAMVRIAR